MMVKLMIPMATFLMLVMGGLPAAADHRDRDRREPKLEKVASKLSRATSELYRDADRSRRFHRSRTHRKALRSFERLEHRACAFEERLVRNGFHDHTTRIAYRKLQIAHDSAVRRLSWVGDRHRLHDEMRRVNRLMDRLDTRVARVQRRHDRHDRYAWGDRDRDRGWRGWRGGFAWNY